MSSRTFCFVSRLVNQPLAVRAGKELQDMERGRELTSVGAHQKYFPHIVVPPVWSPMRPSLGLFLPGSQSILVCPKTDFLRGFLGAELRALEKR